MKKYVIFAAFAAILVACSDDDNNHQNQEQTQKEFFNLKEGNMWVYNRYHSDGNGENPMFSYHIDTLRITGKQNVNGKEYFFIDHSFDYENDEYWRVDEQGHLVDTLGMVIHPGRDTQFTTIVTTQYGDMAYKSEAPVLNNVEARDYIAYPYVADFTPFDNGLPGGRACHIACAEGVGIIVRRARYVSALAYSEYRLVSYDLK